MKRKVGLAILGTILHGSAWASEPEMTIEPSSSMEQVVQTVPAAKSKARTAHARKSKPKAEAVPEVKVEPQSNAGQNAVTEPPSGTIEQPVDLKGVRG